MTPKQFIEKAIKGGWKNDMFPMLEILTNGKTPYANFEAVLLNPKAWEAVGKVEGWDDGKNKPDGQWIPEWVDNMHGMIDALIEGKTTEDYLLTL